MIDLAAMGVLMPAITAGLELANAGVKKMQATGELNLYTDRARAFANLFDADLAVKQAAYATIFADMQMLCAKHGITPSAPYWDDAKQQGSPCLSIPIATLMELMDCASR
jgi:hypothetical protein